MKKREPVEYRLDAAQEQDIIDMSYSVPYVTIARNAFMAMVINEPPEIKLKGFSSIVQSNMLQDIMKQYYLPFIQTMYIWIKMFGIYPWKPVRIAKTDLYRPWIPPLKSGYIVTYMDTRHRQKFKWYWNDTATAALQGKADTSFQFGFKNETSMPSIYGEIRSDLSVALNEYKTVKIARTATETSIYHQSNPQHILEHHPPKINQGDDNLVSLETFGELITGEMQQMQESVRDRQISVRSDALEQSIMQTIRRNRGMMSMFGKSDTLYSESELMRKRREEANGLHQSVTLKPDFVYKAAQMPKISVKLADFESQLNRSLSSIMDFPSQLLEVGNNTAANIQGNLKTINGRIRDWIVFFRQQIRNVFLAIHGNDIAMTFDNVNVERITRGKPALTFSEENVEIILNCAPIASFEDLQQLYDASVIPLEVLRKHTGQIYALNDEELDTGPDFNRSMMIEKKKK